MRFNREIMMGFIIGFFVLGKGLTALMRGDVYELFETNLGITIGIIFGFIFNRVR